MMNYPQIQGAVLGATPQQAIYNNGGAPQRRLEATMKRFEQLVNTYADIAQQAEMLATSLAGPTPEPPSGVQNASPQPIALIGQLETLAEQFNARAQRVLAAIQRIQEL